jgi:hypothetical protein
MWSYQFMTDGDSESINLKVKTPLGMARFRAMTVRKAYMLTALISITIMLQTKNERAALFY